MKELSRSDSRLLDAKIKKLQKRFPVEPDCYRQRIIDAISSNEDASSPNWGIIYEEGNKIWRELGMKIIDRKIDSIEEGIHVDIDLLRTQMQLVLDDMYTSKKEGTVEEALGRYMTNFIGNHTLLREVEGESNPHMQYDKNGAPANNAGGGNRIVRKGEPFS